VSKAPFGLKDLIVEISWFAFTKSEQKAKILQ
jgi:hypothetical protein